MERPVLTILLPVRNEGMNLRIMMKLLGALVEVPYQVLVVYDSAEDSSAAAVEELRLSMPQLEGVLNRRGRGVIHALRAGVEAARGEYVLIFAADEVGPVLAIDDMLALMAEGCDFVSCTRYAHGGRRLGGSRVGGFLSRTANRLLCLVSGSVLTDCTTGIKLFRRSLFDELQLESRPVGWAVAFEMGLKAQLCGLRLGEVPIISIDRLFGGTSTFQLGPWVGEYLRWFWWALVHLRPVLRRSPPELRVRLRSVSVQVR